MSRDLQVCINETSTVETSPTFQEVLYKDCGLDVFMVGGHRFDRLKANGRPKNRRTSDFKRLRRSRRPRYSSPKDFTRTTSPACRTKCFQPKLGDVFNPSTSDATSEARTMKRDLLDLLPVIWTLFIASYSFVYEERQSWPLEETLDLFPSGEVEV